MPHVRSSRSLLGMTCAAPARAIGRRDNDRRRSRLGDIICRLASTNEGEIIATVLVLQRLLEAHGVDIHALVEHLENGGGG
jgi:hypothetical protein